TSVGTMTGRNLDHMVGRTLTADGLATALSAGFGGSPTTTYGENIGVMSATRVYSTAAYWVAGLVAIALAMSPKVGAVINTITPGVLGGVTFVLYGLIANVGFRMWIDGRVDFSRPRNQRTAGVALVIAIADLHGEVGGFAFTGIALGTGAALDVFSGMRRLGRATASGQRHRAGLRGCRGGRPRARGLTALRAAAALREVHRGSSGLEPFRAGAGSDPDSRPPHAAACRRVPPVGRGPVAQERVRSLTIGEILRTAITLMTCDDGPGRQVCPGVGGWTLAENPAQ